MEALECPTLPSVPDRPLAACYTPATPDRRRRPLRTPILLALALLAFAACESAPATATARGHRRNCERCQGGCGGSCPSDHRRFGNCNDCGSGLSAHADCNGYYCACPHANAGPNTTADAHPKAERTAPIPTPTSTPTWPPTPSPTPSPTPTAPANEARERQNPAPPTGCTDAPTPTPTAYQAHTNTNAGPRCSNVRL